MPARGIPIILFKDGLLMSFAFIGRSHSLLQLFNFVSEYLQ
jgi:hypothetical protein